ncbi:MAG: methyltransferase domain-containing protein [Alphaproteobacteria bacterium]|nr:methyltransferase domain-containing protein [Alphaproteobacteria bacterium]MCB9794418.1 methyltransferase domain-containing protein [Alphaproteobacteria bacterium]
MKYRLLQWLACPSCGDEHLVLETRGTRTVPTFTGHWEPGEEGERGVDLSAHELTDIMDGALHCSACSAVYPILDGIPRMLPEGGVEGPGSGHRWTTFDGSEPEYEQNFLDMIHPLQPSDYLGKLVLDAGCGFGRHAFYAARYGAEVVAIDNASDAVASAKRNTEDLNRVHVIQGDINRPPLRRGLFDVVYSFGVLHHVASPFESFRTLGSLVTPTGKLQVWVYGPRAGTAAIASGALRGAAASMEDESLHALSRGIATGLRVFSHTPYRLMRHVPVVGSVVSHLPAHDHHKWPFEVVIADIYDRLRIPVTAKLTGEELERWFAEEGYADIHVTRRVRNNESFRGTGVRR